MKLSIALARASLLASTAIASPYTRVEHRAVRSRAATRFGSLPVPSNSSADAAIADDIDTTDTSSLTNWAGAIVTGKSVCEVHGTTTVPHPKIPPGGNREIQYGGTSWVGIDGDDGCEVILQTGVTWNIQGSTPSYYSWVEWYPGPSMSFDIPIHAGDEVHLHVVAESATSGSATVTNKATGKSATKKLTGQKALCQAEAEWIVEDYSISGEGLVPFANFEHLTFTDAYMIDSAGAVGVADAQMATMVQKAPLVRCSTDEDSTVKCRYVGTAGAQS